MFEIPRKNTAFTFYAALRDQADTKLFKVDPTIAAGDFQISIDGGAFANLATLPVVAPSGGRLVEIALSASEMDGDNVTVVAADQAGAEWSEEAWNIHPQTETILLQSIGMGMRSDLKTRLASTEGNLTTELGRLRVSIDDFQQAILRGRG